MSSTASTDELQKTVRSRLLAFAPIDSSDTLAQRLGAAAGAGAGGKIYITQGPDKLIHPYGIMIWRSSRVAGDDGGFNLRGEIELSLYHYGRRFEPLMNGMMDVVEQAWRDYTVLAVDDSIVAQRAHSRATVPYEAPADRELVCVRIMLPLYTTPLYQSRYSAPLA